MHELSQHKIYFQLPREGSTATHVENHEINANVALQTNALSIHLKTGITEVV